MAAKMAVGMAVPDAHTGMVNFTQLQWRNQEFMLGGAHVSLPSPPLPSSPLRSRPQIQLGGLGERCKLPSGVWGGAPAEIDCDAFLALKYAIWWRQF